MELLRNIAQRLMLERRQAKKEKSEEAIHDLRVATRRFQDLLNLLADQLPEKQMSDAYRRAKKIRRSVAKLRNTDVLLELLRSLGDTKEARKSLRIQSALKELTIQLLQTRRRHENKRGLKLPKIQKQVDALLKENPFEYSLDVRDRGYKTLIRNLRELKKMIPQTSLGDPEKLHRLRIKIKRFRYTLEILTFLGFHQLTPLVDWSRTQQDLLGSIHDLDVLQGWVKDADSAAVKRLVSPLIATKRKKDFREFMRHIRSLDMKVVQETVKKALYSRKAKSI